jgi:hypothetical protein
MAMRASNPKAVAPARRLLAAASLGAAAVGVGSLAFEGHLLYSAAPLLAAGVIGVAAVGLARRSVLTQVLSRGIGWLVLSPMLVGLAESLWHGRLPDAYTTFLATASGAALLLARPALHTEGARAEFSPVAYRRLFLAGAVASAMTAAAAALFSFGQLAWGESLRSGLALAVFSAALLASLVGVVRMRAWGVLLGIASSVGVMVAAILARSEEVGIGLALMAIPGLLLASPLVVARLRPPPLPAPAPGGLRWQVPLEETEDAAPPVLARVRVVAEAEGEALAEPVGLAVGQK